MKRFNLFTMAVVSAIMVASCNPYKQVEDVSKYYDKSTLKSCSATDPIIIAQDVSQCLYYHGDTDKSYIRENLGTSFYVFDWNAGQVEDWVFVSDKKCLPCLNFVNNDRYLVTSNEKRIRIIDLKNGVIQEPVENFTNGNSLAFSVVNRDSSSRSFIQTNENVKMLLPDIYLDYKSSDKAVKNNLCVFNVETKEVKPVTVPEEYKNKIGVTNQVFYRGSKAYLYSEDDIHSDSLQANLFQVDLETATVTGVVPIPLLLDSEVEKVTFLSAGIYKNNFVMVYNYNQYDSDDVEKNNFISFVDLSIGTHKEYKIPLNITYVVQADAVNVNGEEYILLEGKTSLDFEDHLYQFDLSGLPANTFDKVIPFEFSGKTKVSGTNIVRWSENKGNLRYSVYDAGSDSIVKTGESVEIY